MASSLEALRTLILEKIVLENLKHRISLEPALEYIEKDFTDLSSQLQVEISALPTGSSLKTMRVLGRLDLLSLTFRELTDRATSSQFTVDNLAASLSKDVPRAFVSLSQAEKTILQQLAIACIGSLSFFFSWRPPTVSSHCSVNGGRLLTVPKNLHLENCTRPIGSFVRLLDLPPPPYSKVPRPDDLLSLSVLNYAILVRVGRLRIKWVPFLHQHLILDIASKTLYLFEYPSICIVTLAGGNYATLIAKCSHDAASPSEHSIHREILLSLRFILSGTRNSKRLSYRLAFSTLNTARDAAFDPLLEGAWDSFLNSKFPRLSDGKLDCVTRQDFMAPWSEFPLLGERFLELQKYSSQQQPTKTSTMIRDKRNPTQWYLVWAVLFIGGLSVILSAFQLVVSVVQLVYAAKPVNTCPLEGLTAECAASRDAQIRRFHQH